MGVIEGGWTQDERRMTRDRRRMDMREGGWTPEKEDGHERRRITCDRRSMT